nr:heterodisulfide reductase-related iron-sulfur binding cluster [Ilumatobacter fluminis]
MRSVQDDDQPVTSAIVEAFDTCVQCRGCEPACPSGVPYGDLIGATRTTIASEVSKPSPLLRIGLAALVRPRLLRAVSTVTAYAQRLRLVPSRLGVPRLALHRTPRRSTGSDVVLFTGCVMDAWQRHIHDAAQRSLERAGFAVFVSGDLAPCCGALHHHAGLHDRAVQLAKHVVEALPSDVPIVVDSAGCGAAMKAFGSLLPDDPSAANFARRVVDINEFLAEHLDAVEGLGDVDPLEISVAIQDACHLRHVQGVHQATRTLLQPVVRELRELDDLGLCCGAGGAFSVMQPELSRRIRDLKLASIRRADADIVVSANPGCSGHLATAGVEVCHPIELFDRALSRGSSRSGAARALLDEANPRLDNQNKEQ